MTSRDTTDHRASIIELMPHPNTLDQLRWLRTVCHKEYNIARAAEQINVCQNYEQKMEGTTGLLPPPPAANCDLRSVLEYMAEVHENAEYQRLRALVLEDDFLWRGLQSNGLLKVTIAQNLRGEMYDSTNRNIRIL